MERFWATQKSITFKNPENYPKMKHLQCKPVVKKLLIVALLLVPFTLHGWLIFKYTINVPFFDDFQWGYAFLEKYNNELGFVSKIKHLFAQHNEHRIVTTRVAIITLLNLEGDLNFRHFAWFGNIFILGVFGVFSVYLFRERKSAWWLVPIAFFWFQMQHFHDMILSYSVPNNSVIFFAFLSVLAVYLSEKTEKKRYFILSFVAGLFATFSNGNGIVVLFVLLALYMLRWQWYKVIWASTLIISTLVLHFWNYHFEVGKASLDNNTLLFLIDFLSISLIPTSLDKSSVLGIILLYISVAIGIRWVMNSAKKPLAINQVFLIGILAFLCGTALVTAIMRAGYGLPPAPWYKGYSLLLVICFFLQVHEKVQEKSSRRFVLCTALVFSFFNFYQSFKCNISNLDAFYQGLKADRVNYIRNGAWALIPIQANQNFDYFNNLTAKHIQSGTYKIPLIPTFLKSPDFNNTVKIKDKVWLDIVNETYTVFYESAQLTKDNTFGFIRNAESGLIIYYGFYRSLRSKIDIIKGRGIFSDRFSFSVNQKLSNSVTKPGKFEIGFVSFNKNEDPTWFIFEEKLQIENL